MTFKWTKADETRIRWLRERDATLTATERAELRELRRRETIVAHHRRVRYFAKASV